MNKQDKRNKESAPGPREGAKPSGSGSKFEELMRRVSQTGQVPIDLQPLDPGAPLPLQPVRRMEAPEGLKRFAAEAQKKGPQYGRPELYNPAVGSPNTRSKPKTLDGTKVHRG